MRRINHHNMCVVTWLFLLDSKINLQLTQSKLYFQRLIRSI